MGDESHALLHGRLARIEQHVQVKPSHLTRSPLVALGEEGAIAGDSPSGVCFDPLTPALSIAGFAVVGLGLSLVVPQSFSAAGRLDPGGAGIAIARVNLFDYVGFVVGAGLIGAVAQSWSLRWAFVVPAILAAGIVVLAPAFRTHAPAPDATPALDATPAPGRGRLMTARSRGRAVAGEPVERRDSGQAPVAAARASGFR